VATAFLAGTQCVQALIIGKIGQNLLLLLATGVLKEAAGELPEHGGGSSRGSAVSDQLWGVTHYYARGIGAHSRALFFVSGWLQMDVRMLYLVSRALYWRLNHYLAALAMLGLYL